MPCPPPKTILGQEIGYVEKQVAHIWIQESKEISAMIVGLMKSIKTQIPKNKEYRKKSSEES